MLGRRRNYIMILTIWFNFLIQCVQSQTREGSYLIVARPPSLLNKHPSGIYHVPSMFGIPAYGHGKSLEGRVVLPSPNNRDACKPLNKTYAKLYWRPMNISGPLILLIDRGSCNFVLKAQHAQALGINGFVVANNVFARWLPYMADDGTGSNVRIPGMLIRRTAGDDIKAAMANGTSVYLIMTWDMPNPDGVVEWELWTSSNDDESMTFKREFHKVVRVLDKSSVFTPRYYLRDGRRSGCTHGWLPCGSQCTNNGRYCALDPEGNFHSGLDGAHIVRENLRQICLWQELNATNQQLKWWDYVVQFNDTCNAMKEKTWNKNCSGRIMQELGINHKAVFECVNKSGGSDKLGGENKLFAKEIADREKAGAWFLPTIVINGVPYRGGFTCIDIIHCGVLASICAGFKAGTRHPACDSSPGCKIGLKRDKCGICGGSGIFDGCRRCLEPSNPKFKANGTFDACGKCLDIWDTNFNKSCADCSGTPNGKQKMDQCGICGGPGKDLCGNCLPEGDRRRVERGKGGWDACKLCLRYGDRRWNKTCAGCDGVPNSGKKYDNCGVCDGPGKDICDQCLARDDENRVNIGQGGVDKCGVCQRYSSPTWNKTCTGCDGVPNSGKTLDACGVCSGPGKNECGRCSGPGKDACGRCLLANDTRRIERGKGSYDQCNKCLRYNDSDWDKTCLDCSGVPNGKNVTDDCGICGGPGRDVCGNCGSERITDAEKCAQLVGDGSRTPIWVTQLIVIFVVVALCLIIIIFCWYNRRNERRLREYSKLIPLDTPRGTMDTLGDNSLN